MSSALKLYREGSVITPCEPRSISSFAVEIGDALEYFARENIQCPAEVSDGWAAVSSALKRWPPQLDSYELEAVEVALKSIARHKTDGFLVDLSEVI